MNIRVHMKGLLLHLAVLAASLVFASFYGGPAVYAWLYAVLLLIPLSALYILINYKNLHIYQEIDMHRITKGEDHTYRALIENDGFLPIHRMVMHTTSGKCDLYAIGDGQEISLDTRDRRELTSGISCKYAGSYNVGIESVEFTDPFSIFSIEFAVPYTFRAVVSPLITDIADRVLDLEDLTNSSGIKSTHFYEEIPGNDMRPYEAGDPLRSINWKVSAKQNALVSRVPDRMEKRTVSIVAQAAHIPDNCQDIEVLKKRDYFLECIVSAAWHFARQEIPVRLIYPAGKVKESIVDSYAGFMDFYSTVADGIFYNSEEEYRKLQELAVDTRSNEYAYGTSVLIREDPEPGEHHFTVCE